MALLGIYLRLFLATLASVLCAPADAESCPDYDDLTNGIQIETSAGWYSNYFRNQNGIISVVDYDDGGERDGTTSYQQGVLEKSHARFADDGSTVEYAYAFEYKFKQNLEVSIGRRYTGVQFEHANTGDKFENQYIISFHSPGSLFVGRCRYTYFVVTKKYGWDYDGDVAEEVFLPTLGVILDFEPTPYNFKLFSDGRISKTVTP